MPKKLIAVCAAGFGIVALSALADAQRPAQAWVPSPYSWCAQFGSIRSQLSSCSFNSFEQCQATIFGVGGHCYPNPAYVPPEEFQPRRKYRRRHHR